MRAPGRVSVQRWSADCRFGRAAWVPWGLASSIGTARTRPSCVPPTALYAPRHSSPPSQPGLVGFFMPASVCDDPGAIPMAVMTDDPKDRDRRDADRWRHDGITSVHGCGAVG